MPETFERGKKYQVIKKWSKDVDPRLRSQQVRYSLSVGEQLRFRGPNWTGAEFVDADGKLVFLPVKVAFRIMGNLTQRAADEFCGVCQQIHPVNGKCHARNIFA